MINMTRPTTKNIKKVTIKSSGIRLCEYDEFLDDDQDQDLFQHILNRPYTVLTARKRTITDVKQDAILPSSDLLAQEPLEQLSPPSTAQSTPIGLASSESLDYNNNNVSSSLNNSSVNADKYRFCVCGNGYSYNGHNASMCSECHHWFHKPCAFGLNPQSPSKNDSFVCFVCRNDKELITKYEHALALRKGNLVDEVDEKDENHDGTLTNQSSSDEDSNRSSSDHETGIKFTSEERMSTTFKKMLTKPRYNSKLSVSSSVSSSMSTESIGEASSSRRDSKLTQVNKNRSRDDTNLIIDATTKMDRIKETIKLKNKAKQAMILPQKSLSHSRNLKPTTTINNIESVPANPNQLDKSPIMSGVDIEINLDKLTLNSINIASSTSPSLQQSTYHVTVWIIDDEFFDRKAYMLFKLHSNLQEIASIDPELVNMVTKRILEPCIMEKNNNMLETRLNRITGLKHLWTEVVQRVLDVGKRCIYLLFHPPDDDQSQLSKQQTSQGVVNTNDHEMYVWMFEMLGDTADKERKFCYYRITEDTPTEEGVRLYYVHLSKVDDNPAKKEKSMDKYHLKLKRDRDYILGIVVPRLKKISKVVMINKTREVVDKPIKRKQVDREASLSDEESDCVSKKDKKPRIVAEGGRSVTPTPPSQLPPITPPRDPRIKAVEQASSELFMPRIFSSAPQITSSSGSNGIASSSLQPKALSEQQIKVSSPFKFLLGTAPSATSHHYTVGDAFKRSFKPLKKGSHVEILQARTNQPSSVDDPYDFNNEEFVENFEPNASITMPTYIQVPSTVTEWSNFSDSVTQFTSYDSQACSQIEYQQSDESIIVDSEADIQRHMESLLPSLAPLCYQIVSDKLWFSRRSPYDYIISKLDKVICDNAAVVALFEFKPYWKQQKDLINKYKSQESQQRAILETLTAKITPTARNSAFWSIVQICGYMQHSGCPYGVFSTFNTSYFMRYRDHRLEISPPVSCNAVDGHKSAGFIRTLVYFVDRCTKEYNENVDFSKMRLFVSDPKKRQDSMDPTRFASLRPVAKKGSGDYSIVREYQGYSTHSHHSCDNIIVKIIDYTKMDDGMDRALCEINAYEKLKDLQGERVPKMLFYFDNYPFIYIGLSLIDGVTMEEYTPTDDILHQIEETLKLANERKVFLDVSPRNVMIDKTGKVWLINFSRSREQMESFAICESGMSPG